MRYCSNIQYSDERDVRAESSFRTTRDVTREKPPASPLRGCLTFRERLTV